MHWLISSKRRFQPVPDGLVRDHRGGRSEIQAKALISDDWYSISCSLGGETTIVIVDRLRTVVYFAPNSALAGFGDQPCLKGMIVSIAITPSVVASGSYTRSGCKLNMTGRLFGRAGVDTCGGTRTVAG